MPSQNTEKTNKKIEGFKKRRYSDDCYSELYCNYYF